MAQTLIVEFSRTATEVGICVTSSCGCTYTNAIPADALARLDANAQDAYITTALQVICKMILETHSVAQTIELHVSLYQQIETVFAAWHIHLADWRTAHHARSS